MELSGANAPLGMLLMLFDDTSLECGGEQQQTKQVEVVSTACIKLLSKHRNDSDVHCQVTAAIWKR